MEYYEKIAKILRSDRSQIIDMEKFLENKTGVKNVVSKISEENNSKVKGCLESLGLSSMSSAKSIYDALIKKVEESDDEISKLLGNPSTDTKKGCDVIVDFLSKEYLYKGFFLKKDKFIEMMHQEPPEKIMKILGYNTVDELFNNEKWEEIATALRFVEGGDWINEHLLPHYKNLTPDDFEERDRKIIAIGEKWKDVARDFIKKKYHNLSHLKELGIIFIIPAKLDIKGEIIRTIGLLLHYTHEIEFYSDLFRKISKNRDTFSENLIKLLRGDVVDDKSLLGKNDWLIVQRYLAKIDEFDWRLSYQHVNPEAIHWEKAENDIANLGRKYKINGLTFWEGLNFVGDYFSTDTGVDVLVSFNLVDTAMALVKEKEMIKYLYHHQEALWNKIFSSYFGVDGMEESIKENIIGGIIKFS